MLQSESELEIHLNTSLKINKKTTTIHQVPRHHTSVGAIQLDLPPGTKASL